MLIDLVRCSQMISVSKDYVQQKKKAPSIKQPNQPLQPILTSKQQQANSPSRSSAPQRSTLRQEQPRTPLTCITNTAVKHSEHKKKIKKLKIKNDVPQEIRDHMR